MSVNGRTCYYAGAPAQVEILIGTGVTDDARAASMLPVGLSELQQAVVARLTALIHLARKPHLQVTR